MCTLLVARQDAVLKRYRVSCLRSQRLPEKAAAEINEASKKCFDYPRIRRA